MKKVLTIIVKGHIADYDGNLLELSNEKIEVIDTKSDKVEDIIKNLDSKYFMVVDEEVEVGLELQTLVEKYFVRSTEKLMYFRYNNKISRNIYNLYNTKMLFKENYSKSKFIIHTNSYNKILGDGLFDDLSIVNYISMYNLKKVFCVNIRYDIMESNTNYFGKEFIFNSSQIKPNKINKNYIALSILLSHLNAHIKYILNNDRKLGFTTNCFKGLDLIQEFSNPTELIEFKILNYLVTTEKQSFIFKECKDYSIEFVIDNKPCQTEEVYKIEAEDQSIYVSKKHVERKLDLQNEINWHKDLDSTSIFLFMDRPDAADDNAEALYRFFKTKKPEHTNIFFALNKSSNDYLRLGLEGFNLVEYGTEKFNKLYISADVFISSQAYNIHRPVGNGYKSAYNSRFVYLQHGIIYNDMSNWIKKKPFDLFITSTNNETKIIEKILPKKVLQSGLSRFEYYEKNKKSNVILYAPTWRFNIKALDDENFMASDYYKKNISFLNNKKLNDYLEKNDLYLKFKIHPNFSSKEELFKNACHGKNIIITNERYKNLIENNFLTISDYSSIIFDVHYLEIPIVLYQHDQADFYEGQVYEKLEDNTVKSIVSDIFVEEEELIDTIVEKKYKHRETNMFDGIETDKINEKIYERIMKI